MKICTVGRIGFQKNPKLFNEIAQEFPDLQFTWIGDGELRSELTSKNINITGWLERKEVLKELNKNDIFILPSLWEGLPISLLEAMYMKKICIVSDVIGNRDVIDNSKDGFVVCKSNDYVDIILNIKNKKIQTDEIINNSFYKIKKSFSVNNMKKDYKKVYGIKSEFNT